jgi:hypothetical protein
MVNQVVNGHRLQSSRTVGLFRKTGTPSRRGEADAYVAAGLLGLTTFNLGRLNRHALMRQMC